MSGFPTYCLRWERLCYDLLQFRCDYFGRLPRQIETGNAVPDLGQPGFKGLPDQRLRDTGKIEVESEKAANLLYFIFKNHSFTDGNKRIAALIFVWFLERNSVLYKPDGSKRLADNALVALTLMIAESSPTEKDIMVKVVISLINQNN